MTNGYSNRQSFDNGYGVSVISNEFSYGGRSGLFEVAVLHNGNIVYDTPITDDVIGHLTFDEVNDIIEKVKALPPRNS